MSYGSENVAAGTRDATWRDWLALCKPRIVLLIVFTGMVGAVLAAPGMLPESRALWGLGGLTLLAAAAAVINQAFESEIDRTMARTDDRALATGRIERGDAALFALGLGLAGGIMLMFTADPLVTLLTTLGFVGYSAVYTAVLKPLTSQNIVLGGIAGALPPLIGWSIAAGRIEPGGLLLFLIVLIWTPPHFWALAIARREEYRSAGIPMLPVTHGAAFSRRQVFYYTILLLGASLLPYSAGTAGALYATGALVLGGIFVWGAFRLWRSADDAAAMGLFRYSITYLVLLFALMLCDKLLR